MEPTYNRTHECSQATRLIPALIVIGAGVLFLLNNLHVIWIRNWVDYWPVILIAIGLEKLVDSNFSGGRVTGGILMAAGGLFLARNLGYLDMPLHDFWPLILIVVGLLMLWNRSPWGGPGVRMRTDPSGEMMNDTAVFSGLKRKVTDTDFKGGRLTAIFGGLDLNLRRAFMAGDSAVIEVDAVFGGAEVKVPQNWSVVMQGTGIFGGFSDETVQPAPDAPGVKKLFVRGSAVFGGVVVKNEGIMHPLLRSTRRLWFYLLAWTPILALFVSAAASGGARAGDAAAVFVPACMAFAFVCLSPWQICRARPLRFTELPSLLVTFGVAAAAGSLVLVGAAYALAYAMGRPAVLAGGRGGLVFGMGMLLYLFSTGLHYAALAAEASRESERRADEARTLAREAELRALKMQLNPHFLFNCLHSISALATVDGVRAREMCVRLGDFLRSSLKLGNRESIPLHEELALVRRYLEVEKVLLGDRLRVEETIEPGCEAYGVPPLLLQPLVENAIKHGIAEMLHGGSIRLATAHHGDDIDITIENEFDPDTRADRNGLGLAHVRRRLEVRYGGAAGFQAGPVDGVYRVQLRLPGESPMASSSLA